MQYSGETTIPFSSQTLLPVEKSAAEALAGGQGAVAAALQSLKLELVGNHAASVSFSKKILRMTGSPVLIAARRRAVGRCQSVIVSSAPAAASSRLSRENWIA